MLDFHKVVNLDQSISTKSTLAFGNIILQHGINFHYCADDTQLYLESI